MSGAEVVTMLGLAVSVGTFFIGRLTAAKTEGRSSGTVISEIGYIKGGIDDIKREQREQAKTNIEVLTRLTAVEASARQAHKRIDEMGGL